MQLNQFLTIFLKRSFNVIQFNRKSLAWFIKNHLKIQTKTITILSKLNCESTLCVCQCEFTECQFETFDFSEMKLKILIHLAPGSDPSGTSGICSPLSVGLFKSTAAAIITHRDTHRELNFDSSPPPAIFAWWIRLSPCYILGTTAEISTLGT